jgi:hypothetical protein
MTTHEEYIAGFLDGDGTISVRRARNSVPGVAFDQSCNSEEPPELVHIRERWGGRLRKNGSPKKSTQRQRWHLDISKQQDVLRILLALEPHCILKLDQVSDSIAFLQHGTTAHAEGYAIRMHDLKKQYHQVPIDPMRLTDAYIAGLFAAEGSVGLYYRPNLDQYKLKVSITQKGCPRLLEQIKVKIGAGSVYNRGSLEFKSRLDCREILDRVAPFVSGQKAPQVELVREFLQVMVHRGLLACHLPFADQRQEFQSHPGHKRSLEETERSKYVSKRLKEMKKT